MALAPDAHWLAVRAVSLVRIPVHRERPFRSNVNTDSDRW